MVYDFSCLPCIVSYFLSVGYRITTYVDVFTSQILTGKIPYFYIRQDSTVIAIVQDGTRPDRQRYLPTTFDEPMWMLLADCWKANPNERTVMEKVVQRLESFNNIGHWLTFYLPYIYSHCLEEESNTFFLLKNIYSRLLRFQNFDRSSAMYFYFHMSHLFARTVHAHNSKPCEQRLQLRFRVIYSNRGWLVGIGLQLYTHSFLYSHLTYDIQKLVLDNLRDLAVRNRSSSMIDS